MGSKHSIQHVRSLDGKNSFAESLAIRKDAFSSESKKSNLLRSSSEEEVQFFCWNFELTYCYVNGLPNKIETTKNGEGIGLLKPAFSLDPKA